MECRRLWVILILILFFTSVSALSQAGRNGVIEITIVSGTSTRIPGALVTLVGPVTKGRPDKATGNTDKNGRIKFQNLAPGRYFLSAQKEGYLDDGRIALAMPGEAPGTVMLQPDQPVQKTVMRLIRGAVISGKITDLGGAPAAGVQVSVGTLSYQDGRRKLNTIKSAETDSQGQYRVSWFGPGEYYIFTESQLESGSAPGGDYFPATYFPGTADVLKARPVTVANGNDPMAADIARQKVKTYVVTGELLDPPDTRILRTDFSSLAFFYVPRDPGLPELPLSPTIMNRVRTGSGAFNISGIPPGSWNLFAVMVLPPAGGKTFGLQRKIIGRAAIDIRDKNVENVTIRLCSGDVKGRVVMPSDYSSVPPERFPIQNAAVMLQPRETLPDLTRTARVGPDSNFEFSGVAPGRYSLLMQGIPPQFYVADVRVASKSIFRDGILTVGSEPLEPVQIILRADGAIISGRIAGLSSETALGRLSSTYIVLAPPPARRENSLLYRTARTFGLTGGFAFSGIPPGEYKIFALQGLPQGFEQDPAVLARHEKQGLPILIEPHQIIGNLEVDLIRDAKVSD